MNQITYSDKCSACNQPCTRLRRVSSRTGSARWVTDCCGSSPMAAPGPSQTASSPADTSTQVRLNDYLDISSRTSGPAKESGTSPMPTTMSLPCSSPTEPGAQLPHILAPGIHLIPTTWGLTSGGSSSTPTPAAPEASRPAGGEAPSPSQWHCSAGHSNNAKRGRCFFCGEASPERRGIPRRPASTAEPQEREC